MLDPATTLTTLVARVSGESERCRTLTNDSTRKRWGQYFTGPRIAQFMARLLPPPRSDEVRLLDPGAGTGILGIAAAEHLVRHHRVRVHLIAIEPEPRAHKHLKDSLARAEQALEGALKAEAHPADFLDFGELHLGVRPLDPVDFVIANPPYFKLSPSDPRGGDAPNIYARFMEVSAALLKPNGTLCFIVPRSFASGFYFRKFRRRLHATMNLDRVHLFESRRDAFKDEGILQENLIALYTRNGRARSVTISVSEGERDLDSLFSHRVPRDRVLPPHDRHSIMFLPTCPEDLRVMDVFGAWPDTLASYGLEVSTGPVVPFRATEHLVREENAAGWPMLWLQHVRPGGVEWPLGARFRKAERIRVDAPEKLLVPNGTYVIMRRFSAKEEARRLVAAPLLAGQLPGEFLGLENHLNFIHRPRGRLTEEEARALSTLLSSRLFDAYFRISSGNTQVSATELRAMPLPAPTMLAEFARSLRTEEEAVMRPVREANA